MQNAPLLLCPLPAAEPGPCASPVNHSVELILRDNYTIQAATRDVPGNFPERRANFPTFRCDTRANTA